MIQQFTFRKHLFHHILENVNSIFPGIRRAVAIYYDHEEESLLSFEASANTKQLMLVDPGLLNLEPENGRLQNKPYSWLYNRSPDQKGLKVTRQLEISDEYNNNILLIRLDNRHHHDKDLLFLYMEDGLGLFHLNTGRTPVTTREKDLIGQLVYNLIKYLDELHQSNSSFFSVYNESFINTIENLKKKEWELKSVRQNYAQSIISFCNYHLQNISEMSNYKFQLSEKAIEKISDYKDKFELLEKVITNAAAIALNRRFVKAGDIIIVDDTDIVFYSYELEKRETIIAPPDRFSRTRDILDRYENAVIKVLENNLPVTGKNIGKYCSPGISPAAITDAINKHGRKMLILFDKNPGKWPALRGKFRPVINLEQNNRRNNLKVAN